MATQFGTFSQTDLAELARGFIPALFARDAGGLSALVGASGSIEDHKFGRITGGDAAATFPEKFHDWLQDWTFERCAHLRTSDAGERVISEDIMFLTSPAGKQIEWPFATVAVPSADGASTDFFLYYTIWPILEQHTIRPPIFEAPQLDTKPVALLQEYHRCLTSGDMAGLHGVLSQDAYIRESSGPPYVHWGINSVVEYFKGLFKDGAPMMRTERLTADERCTFIEFTVVGWNNQPWPEERHQSGAGIWELNRDGLLKAIRVYDDIAF